MRSLAAKAFSRIRDRVRATAAFPVEFARLRRQCRRAGASAERTPHVRDLHPCLTDRTTATVFDRHYVYHPAWALRVLLETRPDEHVDIASLLHFAAMASAHMPVRFYDYRPAPLRLPNLRCERADLLALPFADRSIASLSCMHVLEHIGLGRYGDPIDFEGDRKAMAELARVVAPGGTLLVVVPVGRPRLVFNAHRVYAHDDVLASFPDLRLRSFALITDPPQRDSYDAGLIEDADPALVATQRYGCGCFRFERA